MPRRAMKRWGILLAAALLLGIGGAYYRFRLPQVERLDPSGFEPGGTILIRGRNFGADRRTSFVSLDGSPLSSSSYERWSDGSIEVSIPFSVDSGLLRVATPFGRSNPAILIANSKLPKAVKAEASGAANPRILSLSAKEAEIGSLLEISGINFGLNMQFSALRFSRNPGTLEASGQSAMADLEGGAAIDFIEVTHKDGLFERWDDKKIGVRVPEGAGSGVLTVLTPHGESPPFPYSIRQGSGSKYLFAPAVYSLQYEIRVNLASPAKDDYVLVYAPDPVSSGSQSLKEVQEESPEAYFRNYGSSTVFRVTPPAEPQENQGRRNAETVIRRTFLMTVYSVETELSSYRGEFKEGGIPEFLKPYAQANPRLPVGAREISSLAAKIVGRERNPQRKAAALWSWLAKNIRWTAGDLDKESLSALGALGAKKAGTRQYVYLAASLFRAAGIPAAPITGFLLNRDGSSSPHAWLEYYLPALGWIPFDPVLALGGGPQGFDAGFQDKSHYFGSLDNRHLAISRDFQRIPSMLESPAKKNLGAAWSDQSLYEEASSPRYSSTWQNIRILGQY